MSEVPESVYLDAAAAIYIAMGYRKESPNFDIAVAEYVERPGFRAAVESAYAAGRDAGYVVGYNEGDTEATVRSW